MLHGCVGGAGARADAAAACQAWVGERGVVERWRMCMGERMMRGRRPYSGVADRWAPNVSGAGTWPRVAVEEREGGAATVATRLA